MSLWLRTPLWQKILVGFISGGIAGYIVGPDARLWFKPIGDLYVTLIKMMVIPLLLTSIISSIANLQGVKGAARLGGKTIAYFLLTAVLGGLVALAVGLWLKPGIGLGTLPLTEVGARSVPTLAQTLLSIVPANPIKAMADGNVLQVLFIALLVGGVIASLGDKVSGLRTLVEEANHVVMKIIKFTLHLTPFGTFGLIAWVVGVYGVEILAPLAKYIGVLYIACLVQIIVVYGGLVRFHGLSPLKFFKGMASTIQIAFATSSSFATLPATLACATNRLGVPREYASFAVPLGVSSMKMDGCGVIFPIIAALFVSQYTGIDLSISAYITLFVITIIGSFATVGVPGVSIVMLTLTLNTVGLPLEAIGYIVAIDRVVDMMRTTTNVVGQAVVPVLVAKSEGILDLRIFNGTRVEEHEKTAEEPSLPAGSKAPATSFTA